VSHVLPCTNLKEATVYRTPAFVFGVLLTLIACSDDPVEIDEDADGITFTASGLQTFAASGTHDPNEILARSFALSFADSLDGLFAMGYSRADSAGGDILILQFPRQPGTYSCGAGQPCHGRLFTGVKLFEHDDGVTGWNSEKYFEIQSGSVSATEVGPTMLRGTFQVAMEMPYGTEMLEISDGRIHVSYSATPPAPGDSHRSIECLLRRAEGQQVVCN
jgi:hypothetical protein